MNRKRKPRRPPFGYSRAEISRAIAFYRKKEKKPADVAAALAFREARDAYRRAHPRGRMLARLVPGARRFNKAKRNPAPATADALREAIARFTGFRAQPPGRVDRGRLAQPGKVVFALGRVLMIGYSTVRAGKPFDYAHEFGRKARPLLVSSSDGRHLFLLGGAYKVSNDGIVDTK